MQQVTSSRSSIGIRGTHLGARNLSVVASERVQAAAVPHVPHLHRVIKRAGDDLLTLRVEVERDYFCRVTQERVNDVARFNIPQPRSVVHRSRRHDCAVRVEGKADDLGRVAAVRMIEVSVVCVPQLARFVCAIARAAGV